MVAGVFVCVVDDDWLFKNEVMKMKLVLCGLFFLLEVTRCLHQGNEIVSDLILVSNSYTNRDGPIGENRYCWDTLTRQSECDAIVDVGLVAQLKVSQFNEDCSYAWKTENTMSRKPTPIFNGLFFKNENSNIDSKLKRHKDSETNIFVNGTDGPEVDISVNFPGTWFFTVEIKCPNKVKTKSQVVHFMSVRREIRSLFPNDQKRYLDALYSLWRVPTSLGRSIHGSSYLDIHDLNNLHRQNAGTRDADHFHEGVGFITQHLKLTRRLEESLQSIDPWLNAPYWDTSIDMHMVESNKLKHVLDSELFSDKFFGFPCNYSTKYFDFASDHEWKQAAIIGGRWSMSLVPRVGDGSIWGNIAEEMVGAGFSVPRNAFGYLRSPWNLNPSPYVTRFVTKRDIPEWVNCKKISNSIKKSLSENNIDSFAQFWSYTAQFPPHAHAGLHDYIGGSFIHTRLDLIRVAVTKHFPGLVSTAAWDAFTHQWLILSQKGLWRSRLIEYPDACPLNATLPCQPVCSDLFPREVVGEFILLSLLHTDAPVLPRGGSWWTKKFDLRSHFPGTKNVFLSAMKVKQRLASVGQVLCDNLATTIKGENFEASGVLDPTFWLIHPTTDRIFQASLLAFSQNTKDLSVDALTRAIWPKAGHMCGSLASCLTCFHIHNWLEEDISADSPVCLSPQAKLSLPRKKKESSSARTKTTKGLLPIQQCCYGHGAGDKLFTSFNANFSRAVVEGPSNSKVLRLLLPNQGPQWELGGTVVFDHFRYDHCKEKGKNVVRDALGFK